MGPVAARNRVNVELDVMELDSALEDLALEDLAPDDLPPEISKPGIQPRCNAIEPSSLSKLDKAPSCLSTGVGRNRPDIEASSVPVRPASKHDVAIVNRFRQSNLKPHAKKVARHRVGVENDAMSIWTVCDVDLDR
jgi:hypothetical protein